MSVIQLSRIRPHIRLFMHCLLFNQALPNPLHLEAISHFLLLLSIHSSFLIIHLNSIHGTSQMLWVFTPCTKLPLSITTLGLVDLQVRWLGQKNPLKRSSTTTANQDHVAKKRQVRTCKTCKKTKYECAGAFKGRPCGPPSSNQSVYHFNYKIHPY